MARRLPVTGSVYCRLASSKRERSLFPTNISMNDFNVVLRYHQSEIIGQSLVQNNIKYDYYIKRGYVGGGNLQFAKTIPVFTYYNIIYLYCPNIFMNTFFEYL